jgi:excisionase family DNA binding protein
VRSVSWSCDYDDGIPCDLQPNGGLLTTEEAAALLHVHPRTVQRLVERGDLSAVHPGGAVRFDQQDVHGLIARVKSRAPVRLRDDVVAPRIHNARVGVAPGSFRDRIGSSGS